MVLFYRTVKDENIDNLLKAAMTTQNIQEAERRLSSLIPGFRVSSVKKQSRIKFRDTRPDFILKGNLKGRPVTFAVEWKGVGEPRYIRQAMDELRRFRQENPDVYPLLVVPYMSQNAQLLAKAEGIGFLDLVGNVWLDLEEAYVERVGLRPERTPPKPIRRLSAPISSRVTRVLLESPKQTWTLSALAREATVSLPLASRVVRRLGEDRWVNARRIGRSTEISVAAPGDLLDALADEYSFLGANSVSRLYSFESEPERLMSQVASAATKMSKKYAFTLAAGAALIAPAARVSDVAFYIEGDPEDWKTLLDLRPAETGGNVLIAKPFDPGVFYRIQKPADQLAVVGNVQLYLDLFSWKGRGEEQAEVLRRQRLGY